MKVVLLLIIVYYADALSFLRLYKDFVEVIRPLKPNEHFDDFDWQSIDSQFMYILDCEKPYAIRFRPIEKGGDDQIITIKEGGERMQVELVDSTSGLVCHKNDNGEKNYFYANTKSFEYTMNPSHSYTVVEVEANGNCNNGSSISYMQNNMKWVRNHDLSIESSILTTWATIINHGKDFKYGDVVELISGGNAHYTPSRWSVRSYTESDYKPSDLHGIKIFKLNGNLTIRPKESIRIPIIVQNVTTKRIVTASNMLSFNHEANGRFHRVYEFTSSEFIPDGRIVVRELGRIVGDAKIQSSIPKGEKHRVKLGIDSDVIYKRNVTSKDIDNSTISHLQLTIINKRTDKVNIEYYEETNNLIMSCNDSTNLQFVCSTNPRKASIMGTVDGNSTVMLMYVLQTKKVAENIWI